jgi:tetratricopeptide (TPR) repeat protein
LCVGLVPAAAQQATGGIEGTAKDDKGKPMQGLSVILHPTAGGEDTTVTTGKDGRFVKDDLPVGEYTITYKQGDTTLFQIRGTVVAKRHIESDLDMSDPKVGDYVKRVKAAAEENAKEGALKSHFNTGKADVDAEKDLKTQMAKATADQKTDLQSQMDQKTSAAVDEFKQADKALDANDTKNHVAIFNQIAEAYDIDGKFDEAANYYQQSIALAPDAAIYNNLGNDLAKAGKMDDAKAAYNKSAEMDPANAAKAYRNFAIVLFNAGKLQGSPAPEFLQKATQLEPNNVQGWYLLGVALAANMIVKQDGDKMTFTLLPGTAEAFQKAISLDPNGPFAAQAKQQIDELKAMGVGIDTKVSTPKTKH